MTEINYTVKEIPLKDIHIDHQFNCRGAITPIDVADLARDIEEKGLQVPVDVSEYDPKDQERVGFKYLLVAGYRRATSFQILKRETIPARILKPMPEVEARVWNLRENLHRLNLNIVQEALSIAHLKRLGLSRDAVARRLGQSPGWIQVRYMILELPEPVQSEIAMGLLSQQDIRDLHTLRVRGAKDDEIIDAARAVKERKQKATVAKVKTSDGKIINTKRIRKKGEIFDLIDIITNTFGRGPITRVLAWCAGEISDQELHQTLQEYAKEIGIAYIPPAILC